MIPSLYRTFRRFGNQPVRPPATQTGSEWFVPGYPIYSTDSPSIDDDPRQAEFAKSLLNRIWEVYGGYTAAQLSNATHAVGTPWSLVYNKYQGQVPKGTDIPTELIKDYFMKLSRNEL